MPKRQLTGKVVSDKMQKTVVVQVARFKQHPKYLRRILSHKKYKAHDENQEYHVGDDVTIEETRPMSKDKSWIVIAKVNK